MEKPVIYVDTRERSTVLGYLEEKAEVKKIKLDTGDFLCSDRVVCERKTTADFLSSISDQRIFKQLEKLVEYQKPVIILEGNQDVLFSNGMHPNTIRGVLSSIAIDYSIPIIWTRSAKETAEQVYWMANREQLIEKREIQIRPNRKTTSLTQEQEFLVAGLPGISNTMSKRLLTHFKTPKKLFSAKIDDLIKVDKIGKKKAEKIKEVIDSKY
ncbi:MAG: ERCC4 domain-containing protein [Candidatus Aenigmatarchaeota archaeon]